MRYLTLMVLLLTGCAEQQFWHLSQPTYRPKHIEVVDDWPSYLCPQYGNHVIYGCAQNHGDTCIIYIKQGHTPNYSCVLEHELRHCAGYDHPNFDETADGCFIH